MDELKRLLRRLDGLDGSKGPTRKAQQPEAQQRGYVGALRGAPVADRDEPAAPQPGPKPRKSSRSAVYVAAATAAVISTVTVYMMMTWQGAPGGGRVTGPLPSLPIVPGNLDTWSPGSGGSDAGGVPQTVEDLVRRAEAEHQGGAGGRDMDTRALEPADNR